MEQQAQQQQAQQQQAQQQQAQQQQAQQQQAQQQAQQHASGAHAAAPPAAAAGAANMPASSDTAVAAAATVAVAAAAAAAAVGLAAESLQRHGPMQAPQPSSLPVPIPQQQAGQHTAVAPTALPVVAVSASPRFSCSLRPSAAVTPQASSAQPLSQAASAAAALAAGMLLPADASGTAGSTGRAADDDSLLTSSSDDDDDSYEFGEQRRVKRTFSRQQRRQRRAAALLAQQQQQQHAANAAALLAQQQQLLLQEQLLAQEQLQTAHAPPPEQLQQLLSGSASPAASASSARDKAAAVLAAAAAAGAGGPLSPLLAAVLGSGPSTPAGGSAAGSSWGGGSTARSTAGTDTAATAAMLQPLPPPQQPLPCEAGWPAAAAAPVPAPASLPLEAAFSGVSADSSKQSAMAPTSLCTAGGASPHGQPGLMAASTGGGSSQPPDEPGTFGAQAQQQGAGAAGLAASPPAAAEGTGVTASAETAPAQEALKAEFQGLSLFEEDDDDEAEGEGEGVHRKPWFKRPRVLGYIAAFGLSAVLFVMGLLTLLVPAFSGASKGGIDLFRFFFFFSAWPLLFVTLGWSTNRFFYFIEWWFYREALCHLDSVRRTARGLVFACLLLPWFVVCFWVAWCTEQSCTDSSTYKAASDVLWKLLVCFCLFCLANFIKSVLAKLLSSAFYKTAHWQKVKTAVEQEYNLLMLSQPRPAPPAMLPPLAKRSHFVHAASVDVVAGSDGEGDTPVAGLPDTAGHTRARTSRTRSSVSAADLLARPSLLPLLAGRSVRFFRAREASAAGPAPAAATTVAGASSLGSQELTLSGAAAVQLANGVHSAAGAPRPVADITARVVVPGFQLAGSARSEPHLQLSIAPGGLGAVPQAAAGSNSELADSGGASRVGSLAQQLAAIGERPGSGGWTKKQATSGEPEVELAPHARRTGGQDDAADSAGSDGAPAKAHGWGGFWKRLTSSRERLLPDDQAPSSPPAAGDGTKGSFHSPTAADAGASGDPSSPVPSRSVSAFAAAAGRPLVASRQASVSVHHGTSTPNGPSGAGGGPSVTRAASMAQQQAAAAAAAASDPLAGSLLQPGVLEAVGLKMDGKAVDTSTLTPQEWERLRAGIALKTFTALTRRHLSGDQEDKQLRTARRFAKGLFFHVRGPATHRLFIIRSDFDPFFTSADAADKAFAAFDKDNDGEITLKEMKESTVAIFKDRKNMAASLKDTDSIIRTLEFGIGVALHFVFAAIYLLVWGMDIVKGFSTFSATVLALTFVFGNSLRQMYEAMLFLFVEHAFDVGDLLEVELITYRVKKIDLLFIVLVKSTGEHVYYPTTRMLQFPVINLSRSALRSEKVVFSLDMGAATSAARDALLDAVRAHFEEHESDFNSCPSVNITGLIDPFKAQLTVSWTYNFSSDETKRVAAVKTALLARLHSCLAAVPGLAYSLVKDGEGGGRGGAGLGLGAGVAEAAAAKAIGGVQPGGLLVGTAAGLAVL